MNLEYNSQNCLPLDYLDCSFQLTHGCIQFLYQMSDSENGEELLPRLHNKRFCIYPSYYNDL